MEFETKLTPVRIGLPTMLNALWDELVSAATEAQQRGDRRFFFEEAEIEVGIGVEAKAEGKLNLHVVEFGSGLTGTRTATVRIKVTQYTEELAAQNPKKLAFPLLKAAPNPDTKIARTPEEAEAIIRAQAAQKSK